MLRRLCLACLRLACLFLTPLAGPPLQAADNPPATAPYELFLLVGQSNMAGRGHVESQDKVPDPRVWMLAKNDAWVPAVDPLHFDKPKLAGVGPGRTFGIAVAAHDKSEVGLVPCAVGGTSINQWKKGGKLYAEAVRRARVAEAHGTFRGVLWHQGEADVDMPVSEYTSKLAELIADFRSDLHAPELPFIMGQLGEFFQKKKPGTVAFNAKLCEFAASMPHCACVSSKGLTTIGDNTHFDAASQREFGHRYAEAYATLTAARP